MIKRDECLKSLVEKIAEDSDRDNFMSPEEAVEYGLIDSVMKTRT